MNNNRIGTYNRFMNQYDATVNRILTMYERIFDEIVNETIDTQYNEDTMYRRPPLLQRTNNLRRRPSYTPHSNSLLGGLGFNQQRNGILGGNNTNSYRNNGILYRRPLIRPLTTTYRRNAIPNRNQQWMNNWNSLLDEIRTHNRPFSPVIVRPTQEQVERGTEYIVYNSDGVSAVHCPIDLQPFLEGERVMRIRHCNHLFRPNNLLRWFETNTNCPLCRFDIREYEEPSVRPIQSSQSNDQLSNEFAAGNIDETKEEENNEGLSEVDSLAGNENIEEPSVSYIDGDLATLNVDITNSGVSGVSGISLDGPSLRQTSFNTLTSSGVSSNYDMSERPEQTQSPTQSAHINNIDVDAVGQVQDQVTSLITDALQTVFGTLQDLSFGDVTMHYEIYNPEM